MDIKKEHEISRQEVFAKEKEETYQMEKKVRAGVSRIQVAWPFTERYREEMQETQEILFITVEIQGGTVYRLLR